MIAPETKFSDGKVRGVVDAEKKSGESGSGALRFGATAVEAVERGNFGSMVALQGKSVRSVPLGDAVNDIKRVPVDGEVVRTARHLGVSFGD